MVLSKITLRHQLYGVAGLFLVPVVLLSCAAAGHGGRIMLDFGWAFSLLAVVTAILVAHRIIAAIDAFDRNIRSLSDDDLHAHIAEAGRGDEIGQIARAVEAFRNRIIEKIADAQSDIKANARKSGMRSRYKLASYNVHAGTKGISHRLGNIDDPTLVIGGATNAGLAEPGTNTAYTITQITILLMGKIRTLDEIVAMNALADMRDRATKEFQKAARILHRDELALREKRALQAAARAKN